MESALTQVRSWSTEADPEARVVFDDVNLSDPVTGTDGEVVATLHGRVLRAGSRAYPFHIAVDTRQGLPLSKPCRHACLAKTPHVWGDPGNLLGRGCPEITADELFQLAKECLIRARVQGESRTVTLERWVDCRVEGERLIPERWSDDQES